MLCLSLVIKSVYSRVVAAENFLDNQKLYYKRTNPVAVYPTESAAIDGSVSFESPADSRSQHVLWNKRKQCFLLHSVVC